MEKGKAVAGRDDNNKPVSRHAKNDRARKTSRPARRWLFALVGALSLTLLAGTIALKLLPLNIAVQPSSTGEQPAEQPFDTHEQNNAAQWLEDVESNPTTIYVEKEPAPDEEAEK